jgi:hypothetical protein
MTEMRLTSNLALSLTDSFVHKHAGISDALLFAFQCNHIGQTRTDGPLPVVRKLSLVARLSFRLRHRLLPGLLLLDALKPLKAGSKRLGGRSNSGQSDPIVEIIPVFEYILNYNEHNDVPEDHLMINLRTAWANNSAYYSKLDCSPAYYAATILRPHYKAYCDV